MRYLITTPEPRWTGEVAGVAFAHGEGLVNDPAARVLNYFLRKGYGVEKLDGGKDEDAVVSEGASSPGSGPNTLQHSPGTSVGAQKAEPTPSEIADEIKDAKDAEAKKTGTSGRRTSTKEDGK